MAKLPSPSSPHAGKQGRRPRASAAADLAVLDHGGGLGRGEGAGRREPAAAALMECGGDAAEPRQELGAAVGLAAELGALL